MYAKKSLRASIQRCKVHRGLVHRIWPPPATLSYIYMGKVGTGCIYRRQTKPTIGYGLQSLEKQWENLETWWAKTKAGSNYIELLNWIILNVYNGNGEPEFCGHLLKKSNVQQSWGFNPSTILRLWRLNQNHWSHFTQIFTGCWSCCRSCCWVCCCWCCHCGSSCSILGNRRGEGGVETEQAQDTKLHASWSSEILTSVTPWVMWTILARHGH